MEFQGDRFRFPGSRLGSAPTPPKGSVYMLGKVPPSLEMLARGQLVTVNLARAADRAALLSNPAAPAVGTGTEWNSGTVANASTLTLPGTTFPAHLRIATSAVADGSGTQFQANVVGTAFSFVSGAPTRETFLSGAFRLSDLTQSELFFGFCVGNGNLLAGVGNHLALYKPDGESTIRLVGSVGSAVPGAGALNTVLADLATAGFQGGSLVNQWVQLALRVSGNTVHAFVQGDRSLGAGGDRGHWMPAHRASAALLAYNAAVCPSFAFVTGEAVSKTCDVANIVAWSEFAFGGDAR